MNVRWLAAGVLTLADGAFGIYLGYLYASPAGELFWMSILVIAISLLCIYGVHLAFLAGAVLSILLPGFATLATGLPMTPDLALIALSLVSMMANILAFRSTTGLSEQAHPLNLPVFG